MNERFVHTRTAIAVTALCLAAGLVQGCATTGWSMPTADRLVELGAVDESANLEALDRGRVIAIMDCRDCHRVYWPQEYHEKRWPALITDMGHRAGMTDRQIQDLTRYMAAASVTDELEAALEQE